METVELTNICTSDEAIRRCYIGTLSCNTLPTIVSVPCCFIANTKPSSHRGEHWIAIYVNHSGRATYFCSYGQPPTKPFHSWMERYTTSWTCASSRLQGLLSTTCGQYCVCFLHFMCRSVKLSDFISLFTRDYDENDVIVTMFVNGLFNVSTTVVNNKQFINKI